MRPIRVLLSLCLLFSSLPALSSKSKTQESTQEGVLVSFADVPSGSSCSGGIYAANCQTITDRHYTVRIGEQHFILLHVFSKSERVGAGLWKRAPEQHSVLSTQLPGAHFQAWSDKEGIHISLGGRESLFKIIGASDGNAGDKGVPDQRQTQP